MSERRFTLQQINGFLRDIGNEIQSDRHLNNAIKIVQVAQGLKLNKKGQWVKDTPTLWQKVKTYITNTLKQTND